MMLLKDLPRYETLLSHAQRYPNVDPSGTASFLLLLRTSSDILESFSKQLSQFHMSQGRFTVLILLNRHPDTPLTPADLADRAGVTRATMTGLLDGLEADGLITRTGQIEDRRRISVQLTSKAIALLAEIMPVYFRMVRLTVSNLNEDERETLDGLMRKLQVGVTIVEKEMPVGE
jgi:DNA-binding MarR family transcriptional regulator